MSFLADANIFVFSIQPVMLTRPQLYKAKTHKAKAEAKTQDGEARFFDLKAQFGAKFMRRQRFEKLKNLWLFISKN